MNVLVLEDSPYRQKEFRSRFPCASITNTVDDCIEAMEAEQEPWDLVFLDHDLDGEAYADPDGHNTGSEMVRWIKINKPKINKIVVHSHNRQAAEMMVLDLLASDYNAQAVAFLDLDWQKLYQDVPNSI